MPQVPLTGEMKVALSSALFWGPYLFVIMSSEFLAELRWEDGFAIPVANEENKTLEEQVRIELKKARWGGRGGAFRGTYFSRSFPNAIFSWFYLFSTISLLTC